MAVRRNKRGKLSGGRLAVALPLVGGVAGALVWRLRRAAGRKGRVEQAMTPNPRAVTAETSVIEAAQILRDEDVGSIPVVAEGRLVGIVSDRDIATRVVAEGRDPQAVAVREVASGDPVVVRADEQLDEALRLMGRHQVRRLPVVENGGRLVGILAQADVALDAGTRAAGATIRRISEPASAPVT